MGLSPIPGPPAILADRFGPTVLGVHKFYDSLESTVDDETNPMNFLKIRRDGLLFGGDAEDEPQLHKITGDFVFTSPAATLGQGDGPNDASTSASTTPLNFPADFSDDAANIRSRIQELKKRARQNPQNPSSAWTHEWLADMQKNNSSARKKYHHVRDSVLIETPFTLDYAREAGRLEQEHRQIADEIGTLFVETEKSGGKLADAMMNHQELTEQLAEKRKELVLMQGVVDSGGYRLKQFLWNKTDQMGEKNRELRVLIANLMMMTLVSKSSGAVSEGYNASALSDETEKETGLVGLEEFSLRDAISPFKGNRGKLKTEGSKPDNKGKATALQV